MTRRLLGPVGGTILFFLVGGLLFAGLGWVTVAALRVEDAQQEAAARAELEHNLHIALWRLDGRMLPSLGVEDSRPYHHYTVHTPGDATAVYGPACAPLLAADLPGWMRLHFEVDAVAGWRSPQVLSSAATMDFQERWPALPLHNATPEREAQLALLQSQYPAPHAVELFARRDRECETGPTIEGVLIKADADSAGGSAPPAPEGARPSELPRPRDPSSVAAPEPPAPGPQPPTGALSQTERDRKSAPMPTGLSPATKKDATPSPPAPADRPVTPVTTTAQAPSFCLTPDGEYSVRHKSQEKALGELAAGRSLPIQSNSNVPGFGLGNANPGQNNQTVNRVQLRGTDPANNGLALNNGGFGGGIGGGGMGGYGNARRGFNPPGPGSSSPEELRKPTPHLPVPPAPFAIPDASPSGMAAAGAARPGSGPVPAPVSPAPPAVPGASPNGMAAAGAASPGGEPAPAGQVERKHGPAMKKLGDESAKGSPPGQPLSRPDQPKAAEQLAMGRRLAGEGKSDLDDKEKSQSKTVGKLAQEVAGGLSRFDGSNSQGERERPGSDKDSYFRANPKVEPRDSKKEPQAKDAVASPPPTAPSATTLGASSDRGGALRDGQPTGPGGPMPRPLDTEAGTRRAALPAAPPASPLGGFAGPLPAAKPVASGPVTPTPDPVPPAKLEPVAAPPNPPPPSSAPPNPDPAAGGGMPLMEAAPPAIAVHPGPMRPQWLTLADGSEILVLVRSARLEGKVVYQGVALDWSRLQMVLQEEIKGIFPEGTLLPVKDPNGVSRDRTMAALPVQLDPGPTPTPPTAGWTPLRLGLLLAWTAAVIAFAAVGLCGWSLIDLAERRIRFVSAVTHELRTPLTSLRLYLDLLLSGLVQDEAKRTEYLSTLNAESDRLHRLIDNVLDFARLERRRAGNSARLVKVNDQLDQLRLTWTDRCAADGKELVVISTLPPDAEVCTNPDLMQQIVGNLIDNARKYTRDATDARIWVWAKPDGPRRVVFEVEDRGSGVPTRERGVIFRPFRRGEGADTRAGGAGLGLALSKQWAEMLGGRLTYRPADGGTGACFRLELRVK